MITWLGHHRAAAGLAFRRLAAAPVNTVLAIFAIGVALALPAGGQMLLSNVLQLAHNAAPKPQLSVFMQLDSDRKAADSVAKTLEKHPTIKSVQLLTKEETLARMKESAGLKDVIEALSRNPFPNAFIVMPLNDGADAMEKLASELRKLPKVEHVQLDSAWIRRLDALLKLGRTGVALLSLLLGVGLVAITFNIIRLQVLTQRAEVELSQLLGATDGFIRRPFLYFGSMLGIAGGLVAWLLVAGTTVLLRGPLSELTELYGLQLSLSGLDQLDSLALFILAAFLGWTGAALSLRQHLRVDS